jgi:hypothetical protein
MGSYIGAEPGIHPAGAAWGTMASKEKRPVGWRCILRPPDRWTAALFGAMLIALTPAFAAEVPQVRPHPARDFNTYQPTARATRIDESEAPKIDGDLSDPVWAKAEVIDEFYQTYPNPGQPASQPTVARFLYDENTLYVGIYAYDSEPEKMVATVRARDARVDTDDGVRIYLDPELSRRNAYYFEMNALGARVDALIQNNATYIDTWNTIWSGRAKINADGFSVEMAIPFKDLSFDPSRPNWGLEIQRRVRRTGERIRWSNISGAAYYADVSRSGTLTGISDITQGLGLDVQLYGKLAAKREWQPDERDFLKFVASGNAYYKITPGLTGTLTVNPDFSDSPLDIRQVNTTRFVLFQPETRDFFLQDAPNFEFGGRSYLKSGNITRDNGRPFFSRNIGLANGRPVSITMGGKLSGEAEGIGIGALSVLTDGTGITRNRQSLSAARITKAVFAESKVGMVFTNGDPSGFSRNTVAGGDFQYLDSNFFPGKVLQSDWFYQRSFSNTKGDDDSFGATLYYPNEPWGADIHFKQIGENFFPALGFINRTGIRSYDGYVLHRQRNAYGLRLIDLSTMWSVVTGLSNRIESRENVVQAQINTPVDDLFNLRVINDFEDVPQVFRIASRVPVPVGRYGWTNIGGNISTSDARPYSAKLDVVCCSFYNGNSLVVDFQIDYRPVPLFQFGPHYTFTSVRMPTGSVDIHLAAVDVILNFTPDMQLFTQIQYDNISQKFALSMRYRWEYQPGNEIFASIGQGAVIPTLIPNPTFTPQLSQAVIRIGNTFRF